MPDGWNRSRRSQSIPAVRIGVAADAGRIGGTQTAIANRRDRTTSAESAPQGGLYFPQQATDRGSFANRLSLCRAFSASPSFLRLPRAALGAETGLRLP